MALQHQHGGMGDDRTLSDSDAKPKSLRLLMKFPNLIDQPTHGTPGLSAWVTSGAVLLCVFFLGSPVTAFSQIYLQMEKLGSPKSHKFPVGQEISFRLAGRDYFVTEKITEFRPEEQLIITETELFFAHQIEELKPDDYYHRKGRFFIYPLYALGGSATAAGVIGTIYELKLRPGLLLPGPVIFGLAWLLHRWIDRPYATNQYRFRVVDLRMTLPEDDTGNREWTEP